MAYTPDYSSGDVAKAGQNTITVGIIEIGSYMSLIVLAVVIGFLIGMWKKHQK